jgi:hypothetical protein
MRHTCHAVHSVHGRRIDAKYEALERVRGFTDSEWEVARHNGRGADSVPAAADPVAGGAALALSWLTLLGLPRLMLLPDGWHAHVSQRGHASILSQALAYLDEYRHLPDACLPAPS